jgi:hypothetical protein
MPAGPARMAHCCLQSRRAGGRMNATHGVPAWVNARIRNHLAVAKFLLLVCERRWTIRYFNSPLVIRSAFRYGRKASGMTTLPSACW